MRVLMIAPPGAGKGTQGALIAAHFDIPHIATGELLRDHVARRTTLGQAVQTYLDRGDLVPTRSSSIWCGRRWSPRRRPEAGLCSTGSRETCTKPVRST